MDKHKVKAFQKKILSWYEINKRDLPWRKTKDPYKILVSEIMLQQTQVSRVISKYEAWLERFPDVKSLAEAPTSEVLRYWSGLGYNRRALNLQKAAQAIVQDRRNAFPANVAELIKLPGIGEYTASAVACFAFNAQIPVIDTNVRKVILVEFGIDPLHVIPVKAGIRKSEGGGQILGQAENDIIKGMTDKEIEKIALEILPEGQASDWNQALMDYSSAVLKKVKIPIVKQSHFRSSDRWYRGQIVKLLLDIRSISFSGLHDYFVEINSIEPARLEAILLKLEKDGLVHFTEGSISMRE